MKKFGLLYLMLFVVVIVHAQKTDLKVGDKLPDFELNSSVYGNVSASDLKGKVVLISLFATWCGPCQKELAEVEEILWAAYKKHKDFVLLVVGREHTDEQLEMYNKKKHFTFPLYPDPERKVFSLFAEQTIPRTYLIDKTGKIVYASMGYDKSEFNQLMQVIDKTLKN